MNGVYYVEGLDLHSGQNMGIEQKVLQQIKCLKNLGKLKVMDIKFEQRFTEKIKFTLPFIKSEREVRREKLFDVLDEKIDYIYIRKPSLSIGFYRLLKKIKKKFPSVYIILEIPTYPFHFEYNGMSKLRRLKSKRCEKRLKKVLDKIVTYSDDEEIWGVPTLRMSNCVAYNDILPRSKEYALIEGVIRLTCVARFMYWHGVDRLIEGIKRYDGDYDIELNIVGDGPEIEHLKKLAKNVAGIVFHGKKFGEELSEIFNKTDIAVDALGRHRSGVYYNSSLKGKEYVARGIPVISAVRTELDNMKDFPYYLKLPADDSCIDVKKVVKFYERIYSKKSPEEITEFIREETDILFDYKYGFEEVIYNELLSGGGQQ